jgi:hypothetical protein
MNNKLLAKNLTALGYPLMETETPLDANTTLAAMVVSRDLRLWEGFPVVLANSNQKGLFDYDRLRKLLTKNPERSQFEALLVMSLAFYKTLNLRFTWTDKLYRTLSDKQMAQLKDLTVHLKENTDFKLGTCLMASQRLKTTFNNYFNQVQSDMNDLLSLKAEVGLEYALSQVFPPKQKELFFKKVRGEKLTKTEKEYFSRVVRKRVLALANPELHRLARRLLE